MTRGPRRSPSTKEMTTFPQEKIKIEKRIKTGTKLVLITEQIH